MELPSSFPLQLLREVMLDATRKRVEQLIYTFQFYPPVTFIVYLSTEVTMVTPRFTIVFPLLYKLELNLTDLIKAEPES